MKNKQYLKGMDAPTARQQLIYDYREKYFNLWLNSWKFKGLSRNQREFVMRRLWSDGQVAAFDMDATHKEFLISQTPAQKEQAGDANALLGFAPFAPQAFDMYNYPTAVILINNRGVPYIPTKVMIDNVDVILIYAQHSRQPLETIVDHYIDRIVDVEMTIRTNLYAQKMPLVIEVTPNSTLHAEELNNQIEGDESHFFVNTSEIDSLKSAGTNTPYIIDKLYTQKTNLENELNTFLGIDNIGNVEKKERLIKDEANSNNDIINDFGDSVLDNLKAFCESAKKYLKIDISVKAKNTPVSAVNETPKSMKGKVNNGNNL